MKRARQKKGKVKGRKRIREGDGEGTEREVKKR